MNATDLIKYIYDSDKINIVLEKVGCSNISDRGKEFRCGLPDDTSKTRVRVKKNEYLNITIFQSDDETIRGNIITLVMHILNISFPKANKIIHDYLGLEYKYTKKEKKKENVNPLDFFKNACSRRNVFDVSDIDIFGEEELMEFTPNLHKLWLEEGILSFTARKFGIGYDYKRKRIVIPHRMWSGDENDYVGIIGRTTIPNHDMFDIPKYFPIKSYPKSMNLYGLNENYRTIQEQGYVTVFEAEKSVLKRHSRLDGTGVALMCHDFDTYGEQVSILTGLNVEVVIAMDKGIKQEHVWAMCDKFYGVRKVSYIWDSYDIIPDKESPADMHNKIYNSLFKHRTTYDADKKRRYDKWLKEKQEKNLKK